MEKDNGRKKKLNLKKLVEAEQKYGTELGRCPIKWPRPKTDFELYLEEEYRKNPGLRQLVAKEKRKLEKGITFFNRVFIEWLKDKMEDERFRKILEKNIASERKWEKEVHKSILKGMREAREGKTIPYEEIKKRLGWKK